MNPGRHPGLGKVADYVQNVLGEVLAALIGVPPSFIAQARASRSRVSQLVAVSLLGLSSSCIRGSPGPLCSSGGCLVCTRHLLRHQCTHGEQSSISVWGDVFPALRQPRA